jgi:hypothetical protein
MDGCGGCGAFVRFTGDDTKPVRESPTGGALLGPGKCPLWGSSVDYQAAQVRDEGADAAAFPRRGLRPREPTRGGGGTVVQIREASVTPSLVKRGNSLVIATDYSVESLDGAVDFEIAEEWHVYFLGVNPLSWGAGRCRRPVAPVAELDVLAIKQRRKPGGWRVSVKVGVPTDALAGEYRVSYYLNTGSHQDRRDVRFIAE